MTAFQWDDTDLPISYEFLYTSYHGNAVPMCSRAVSNRMKSVLPAGRDIDSYDLPVHLKVYDSFNAVSSDTVYVKVSSDPLLLWNSFDELLNSVELSTDPTNNLNLYAISVVALTRVPCEASPDCISLHREGCRVVENTCGPCLTGFTGSAEYSNDYCVSNSNSSILTLNTERKLCPNNCFSRGTCIGVDTITQSETNFCEINDSYCRVKCVCFTGFGGQFCELDSASLFARQNMVEKFLQGYRNFANELDVDLESIHMLQSSLSLLPSDSCYFTTVALIDSFEFTQYLMENAVSFESSLDHSDGFYRIIDLAMSLKNKNSTEEFGMISRRLVEAPEAGVR